MKSSPHSQQLEKARAQQRPNAAKKKKKNVEWKKPDTKEYVLCDSIYT